MSGVVNYFVPESGVFPLDNKKSKGLKIRYHSVQKDCGIIIYDRKNGQELGRYPFDETPVSENVYELTLQDYALDKISYQFYEGNKTVIDKRALMFAGTDAFGTVKSYSDFRAISLLAEYDWEEDQSPELAYHESIGYCMHVRGFTAHKSSKVRAKGTFKGIIEKIPYLKSLGITTLELQPSYEFVESTISPKMSDSEKYTGKLNYWGYKEAFYYVPKRAYAYGKDSSKEFKDMVKALHRNGMEIIMQFYFPEEFMRMDILPVLRYWHKEYHVDGFHVKGKNLPIQDILTDAYLCKAKIWCEGFPSENLITTSDTNKRAAIYNDSFLCVMRGFLKADCEMLKPAMDCMMRNPSSYGVVNYLTNYYGFTMADMVSYQKKHNEANGEENRDGTDYNCTWNCGVEGNTRKAAVKELRLQQIKNAFALLLFSQGMPLFFMGDEFGNSQKGNNNPYSQDNEITWLNWHDSEKNKNIYEYVQKLIQLRKTVKIFSNDKAFRLCDYLSVEYPDLSFHDEEAWKYSWDNVNNHIGFMVCGDYVAGCEGTYWYVAVNTHWEEHVFALPGPENKKWKLIFTTNDELDETLIFENDNHTSAKLSARSLCVFVAK